MKKVALLLKSGDFTVAEVSYKIGFNDPTISVNASRTILENLQVTITGRIRPWFKGQALAVPDKTDVAVFSGLIF